MISEYKKSLLEMRGIISDVSQHHQSISSSSGRRSIIVEAPHHMAVVIVIKRLQHRSPHARITFECKKPHTSCTRLVQQYIDHRMLACLLDLVVVVAMLLFLLLLL